MINIYEAKSTNFDNFGLAVLNPLTASIKEKINGLQELIFTIPFEYSDEIKTDRIVKADGQLYRIKRITLSDENSNIIEVYAQSILQDLIDDFILTFFYSNRTVQYMLSELLQGTIFNVGVCDNLGIKSLSDVNNNKLKQLQNILQVYQGEVEIDGLTVFVRQRIGENRGVRIRSGKNLKGIKYIEDIGDVVTRLQYKSKKDGIPQGTLDSPFINYYANIKNDFQEFDAETKEELDAVALGYLQQNDKPYISYEIDLVELCYTEEYKEFADLEQIRKGDTVIIQHDGLGIDIQARILEVERDILNHTNTKVVLGNFRENYFNISVAFQTAKNTLDYAFSKGKLNAATLKGIKIVDEDTGHVMLDIDSKGKISIDITENSTVKGLEDRLDGVDIQITQDSIVSKIRGSSQYQNDISTLQTQISQNSNSISLKADKTITDGLETRMSNAEQKITADAIVSTVRSSASYTNDLALKTDTTTTNALITRLSTAESNITQNANQIALKVSTTDYNGNTIASLINQTSKSINMSALNIDLTGFVTFNALSGSGTTTINGSNITTGTLSASKIIGGYITGKLETDCLTLKGNNGYAATLNFSNGVEIASPDSNSVRFFKNYALGDADIYCGKVNGYDLGNFLSKAGGDTYYCKNSGGQFLSFQVYSGKLEVRNNGVLLGSVVLS